MKWEIRKQVYDEYFFTKQLPLVDSDGVPVYCPDWDAFAQMITRLFNPQKVLDCGCATGGLVVAFNRQGVEAHGFELSDYAVRHSFAEAEVILSDAALEQLPYSDGYFDLVIAIDFFEHQDDEHLDFVVHNVARVCSKWLFIKQPLIKLQMEVEERVGFLRSLYPLSHTQRVALIDTVPEITTTTPDPNCPYHPQERGRAFFIELFTSNGFEEVTLEEDAYRPNNPNWICSLNTLVFRKR